MHIGKHRGGAIGLTQAISAVITTTLVGGFAGGVVGAFLGNLAPSFIYWLHSPIIPPMTTPEFDPAEFALGLGTVCGLLMGAATGLLLVSVLVIRDAWIYRHRTPDSKDDGVAKTRITDDADF